MRNFSHCRIASICFIGVMVASSALQAADPAYVGTWGDDAAQCKNSQETSDAPLMITAKGYDQHETHCSFVSVSPKGNGWMMKAKCSVEGDAQTETLEMSVSNDKLSIAFPGEEADVLIRC